MPPLDISKDTPTEEIYRTYPNLELVNTQKNIVQTEILRSRAFNSCCRILHYKLDFIDLDI